MKVFFAPYFSNNPYQKKIIDNLKNNGVDVSIAKTGSNEFFKTKGLSNASVIHFHWFEPYIKSSSTVKSFVKAIYFLFRLYLFKKNRKFVWTVHNLVNHEKTNVFVDKFFLFFFTKLIDNFCVHNKFTVGKIKNKFNIKSNKISIIPHGNYANTYDAIELDEHYFKREIMKVDANKITFTFLGQIRPYKGVIDLIDAFISVRNDEKSQLLICGKVYTNEDKELIQNKIKDFKNIIFKPGYVKDSEVYGYLKCSDVLIYPYKNILTSGALILGMSMKKTCIASNVGSMKEFLNDVYLFNNKNELTNLIIKLEKKSKHEFNEIGKKNFTRIEDDTWSKMAIELGKIYSN